MRSDELEVALQGALHLEARLVPKPWGGTRLKPAPGSTGVPTGERWEVADLDPAASAVDGPVTPVATGPLAGATLREMITTAPDSLLGDAAPVDGGFPLLVKLLDAGQHLSVQVHPPAGYIEMHPEARLKSESWIVLDAEPGAGLWIGLEAGVAFDDLRAVAGTPDVVPLLKRWPAVPGEVHHLPAGTIHALGAGTLVAEVQTPSDTTFRLYDWNAEYSRAPRGLHVKEALACIELAWEHNQPSALGPVRQHDGTLVRTAGYTLDRRRLAAGEKLEPRGDRPEVLYVVSGCLEGERLGSPLGAGGVALLPAVFAGSLHATAPASVLVMRP